MRDHLWSQLSNNPAKHPEVHLQQYLTRSATNVEIIWWTFYWATWALDILVYWAHGLGSWALGLLVTWAPGHMGVLST
jgi:hypothetical protein